MTEKVGSVYITGLTDEELDQVRTGLYKALNGILGRPTSASYQTEDSGVYNINISWKYDD